MQDFVSVDDYLLLIPYLLLFYFIVRKRAARYEGTELRKYFITSFYLRMIGSILCGLLFYYYYGYGDTFGFYQGSDLISDMIMKDISNLKYLFSSADDIVAAAKNMGLGEQIPVNIGAESNVTVMKIAAILSFFTFNKYMVLCITFGLFSFIGSWKLYHVFYNLNEQKNGKLLAIAFLYTPTLWIWGGGLLKEPLCVGALGFIVHLLYKMFVKKIVSISDFLMLAFMLALLTIVKNYITVIFVVSVIIMVIAILIKSIKIKLFRYGALLLLGLGLMAYLTFNDASEIIQPVVDIAFDRIETFKNSYQMIQEQDESSRAGFMTGDIYPTLESLIANSPLVVATCLFRPFMWESPKIIIFFASLEATLTLLATLFLLWKTKFFGFFAIIFTDPILIFCFIFSLLFALLIGFTTFNFGTMVRYKIMFLPFYLGMLIMVYHKYVSHHNAKAEGEE